MAAAVRRPKLLALFGAAAAGVAAIDAVSPEYCDSAHLRVECEAACRDGFTAKLASHPRQVPVINEIFTPSAEAIARAGAIIAAFAADPDAGTIGLGGEMLGRSHLKRAERMLARAASVKG